MAKFTANDPYFFASLHQQRPNFGFLTQWSLFTKSYTKCHIFSCSGRHIPVTLECPAPEKKVIYIDEYHVNLCLSCRCGSRPKSQLFFGSRWQKVATTDLTCVSLSYSGQETQIWYFKHQLKFKGWVTRQIDVIWT